MTAVVEAEATETEAEKTDGRKERERDFTKFTEKHQDLANFVNSDEKYKEAKLAEVTPNQVKAILALRTAFNDTPEQAAKREEARLRREEEKKEFAGLSEEEIKAEKAARRAETQAAKMQARVDEALAKAAAIREGKDASGADLAAAVEAQQNGSEAGGEKRRITRKK